MIGRDDLKKIIDGYHTDKLTIGTLGGHSALDVCRGAKDLGFRTVVVCQKGREKTYSSYYRSDGNRGIVDDVILVDSFADVVKDDVQKRLRQLNTIFVHSRYFWVYCDFGEIENRFKVPIFGSRGLLRAEERDQPNNQYFLLENAGIKTPKRFVNPQDIDRLSIVKAAESDRGYEREFFFVSSYDDYVKKSAELLKAGKVNSGSLKKAVIEEFVLGPQVNLNFFHSPLTGELELLGTDTRRQTNIDGFLRLTAAQQLGLGGSVRPKYIENGHVSVTLKESLLEKAFEIGERFVASAREHYPPGIIGPFALQGAVLAGPPKEEFVVFDVSMRIPGSPGTRYTPYGHYLYGEDISVGKRIAMEIRDAVKLNHLIEVLT
ncbi:formate--phosphoribosylaminoimidazolecarboxamide ligase family protein [Candidatus Woesearchaeota archaeon]|nr:formate--phosphoribosylaminoimidazolecarboxamide ligase family protein [Candidatus Woesearchaeota archaeon]